MRLTDASQAEMNNRFDETVRSSHSTATIDAGMPAPKAELRLTLCEIENELAEACERVLVAHNEGREPDILVLREYLKGTAVKRDKVAKIVCA